MTMTASPKATDFPSVLYRSLVLVVSRVHLWGPLSTEIFFSTLRLSVT